MCGFLLRPKHVLLYRIKYYPGYFSTQKNIIFDISEKISSFETAQDIGISKKSSFRDLLCYEYAGRVFYSIEENVFETQEKTVYQKKILPQRKKIKKYPIFASRSSYFCW